MRKIKSEFPQTPEDPGKTEWRFGSELNHVELPRVVGEDPGSTKSRSLPDGVSPHFQGKVFPPELPVAFFKKELVRFAIVVNLKLIKK